MTNLMDLETQVRTNINIMATLIQNVEEPSDTIERAEWA